ncbi:hypothetical protein [Rhizobium mayense]|uniref:Uncharacterized protein n=1 Tax=Rhizobium mayense TaxID=1312184 RepID=A0ABT7JU40_9HYPH|nr:hypothetical protein [Rhizobium mayense]MDL2398434.1 hypothetical protein [Rhizobium mayense]
MTVQHIIDVISSHGDTLILITVAVILAHWINAVIDTVVGAVVYTIYKVMSGT